MAGPWALSCTILAPDAWLPTVEGPHSRPARRTTS